jgi:protein-S-isoprenylcysteine O-methyltransferase Ste14
MGELMSAEGSLSTAIAALLVVMALRFARPVRAREWGAIASYVTAIVVTLLAGRGLLPGASASAPATPVRLAGAGLVIAGLLLAGSASRALASAGPGALVTSGPYGRLRHPLYTGLVLSLAGNALRWPSRVAAIATLACAALYFSLAAAEDGDARRSLGDRWERYAAVVPAVFGRRRRV